MIKLLPYWVLTNRTPGFYDSESGSTIEQTAKVYKAMRELQEDYNEFVTEINKNIIEFESSINKDNECFRDSIIKTVEDYITSIDIKIANQDLKIDNAIKTMTDSLSSTIEGLLVDLLNSGEIDQIIVDAINKLEVALNPRVTKLEQSVADIITTLNNEVTEVNTLSGRTSNLESGLYDTNIMVGDIETNLNNASTKVDTLEEKLICNEICTSEADFKASVNLKSEELDLTVVGIEYFSDSTGIDTSLLDGNDVVLNKLDSNKHEINIGIGETKSIVTKLITLDSNIKKVWIKTEHEGIGNVTSYVSVDNGATFTEIPLDTLTDYSVNGTQFRIKLTIIGEIKLKNMAWGLIQ